MSFKKAGDFVVWKTSDNADHGVCIRLPNGDYICYNTRAGELLQASQEDWLDSHADTYTPANPVAEGNINELLKVLIQRTTEETK